MKVIILAGESGTRLFPLSRADYPKQFLKVFYEKSLLIQSITRYAQIARDEDIIVVAGEKHEYQVRSELNAYGLSKVHVVFEPEFKDAAASMALGLAYCKHELGCADDEIIFVSGSDALVSPVGVFLRNMRQGLSLTGKGKIVMFGVKPTSVTSRYGYIKIGEKIEDGYIVDDFAAQADEAAAAKYVEDGYYWNAGFCVFQLSVYFKELKEHAPEVYALLQKPFAEVIKNYQELSGSSDGNIIVKKSSYLVMVILNCFWNDIGSWDDMYEAMIKDEDNNAKQGDIVTLDCQDSLFIGKKRLIAGVGLSNTLVVETDDVILVAEKGKSDLVRDLVGQLKEEKRQEAFSTNTVFKPWGYRIVLDEGKHYKISRIVIESGAVLAMHMHYHHSEHLVVVEGSGKALINGEEQIVYKNQSVSIPVGAKYQLSNPGLVPLEIIEVQNGEYIGEDDVVYIKD